MFLPLKEQEHETEPTSYKINLILNLKIIKLFFHICTGGMWNRWDHKTEMTFLALSTIVFALVLDMQQLVAKFLCYIVFTRGQGVCLCKQSLCLFNLLHVLRIFKITANLLFASEGQRLCLYVFFFFF